MKKKDKDMFMQGVLTGLIVSAVIELSNIITFFIGFLSYPNWTIRDAFPFLGHLITLWIVGMGIFVIIWKYFKWL